MDLGLASLPANFLQDGDKSEEATSIPFGMIARENATNQVAKASRPYKIFERVRCLPTKMRVEETKRLILEGKLLNLNPLLQRDPDSMRKFKCLPSFV